MFAVGFVVAFAGALYTCALVLESTAPGGAGDRSQVPKRDADRGDAPAVGKGRHA